MQYITAVINLTEDVPRPHTNGGIKSGYMPHHKFSNIEYLVSGLHKYSDEKYHYVGETLVTKISFPSWDEIRNLIKVGDHFEIQELNKKIGGGVVQSVHE